MAMIVTDSGRQTIDMLRHPATIGSEPKLSHYDWFIYSEVSIVISLKNGKRTKTYFYVCKAPWFLNNLHFKWPALAELPNEEIHFWWENLFEWIIRKVRNTMYWRKCMNMWLSLQHQENNKNRHLGTKGSRVIYDISVPRWQNIVKGILIKSAALSIK